ncbi:MAG: hypothetical protein K9J81_01110 [Desulfohalobiaceae bacterium]|nr:hypothetical protein [Desulfohalobiaceae bacterium]
MIDLHSHILPAVDDGPRDWGESLAICRLMVAQGIKKVVATPHYWTGVFEPRADQLQSKISRLVRHLQEESIELTVLAGMEVALNLEVPSFAKEKRILPLNGSRYLLLELPQLIPKEQILAVIFQLQLLNIVPIIAHPEKNPMIQKNPELMVEFVKKGALGQITTSSLLRKASKEVRNCAGQLLERRVVQLMATDSHSENARPPLLRQGLKQAAVILGSRLEAEAMVLERPERILRDQSLRLPDIRPPHRQAKGLRSLLGKAGLPLLPKG